MPRNPLHGAHTEMGAFLVERAGTKVPARYADAVAEHRAAETTAGVFDLTSAGKLRVRGGERLRFLNGLLAADLRPLLPGLGCYSLLLARDGRIASELRVAVLEDEVVLLTPSIVRGKLLGTLSRHIVTSDVAIEDASETHALISVQGPLAAAILTAVLGGPLPALPQHGIAEIATNHGRVRVIRAPRTAAGGFDLLVPAADAEWLFRRVVAQTKASGGLPCGLEALEGLRVAAGRPAFGAEMDETTFPSEIPEAAFAAGGMAIGKGCFLGREAALAAAAAAPTRRLVGVVCGSRVPPVRGDRLLRDGKVVGRVTTGAFSPHLGHGVGLALVAPAVTEPGTELMSADGDTARVSALPFATAADAAGR